MEIRRERSHPCPGYTGKKPAGSRSRQRRGKPRREPELPCRGKPVGSRSSPCREKSRREPEPPCRGKPAGSRSCPRRGKTRREPELPAPGKDPPRAGIDMPGKSRREPEPLASGKIPPGAGAAHAREIPPGVGVVMPGETPLGAEGTRSGEDRIIWNRFRPSGRGPPRRRRGTAACRWAGPFWRAGSPPRCGSRRRSRRTPARPARCRGSRTVRCPR